MLLQTDIQKYVDERLNQKINWYNAKSKISKKRHYSVKTIEIMCALLIIPFVTFEEDVFKYLTMLLSFIVASLAGLQELYKFQKNWMLYRNTYEELCSEKSKYYAKVESYNHEKADDIFVNNIERILKKEHSEWTTLQTEKSKAN